ncbi:phosphohistidine phosphatase SixA [Waterburya agarophytonicola K14]|uniref:Phosphohistidine phosphatase SixA n=1 Tax=Waterburya agarophytonicola KI4 TaxID=2874699 RepID=A0A964FH94_9CYAN|nr:phosphohistidine phosphatase SixA [Waterburya agarophytonicola]MCC0178931.1 phosphohistidine phosphatase SixA [Waterburya agarophytonicola KI4]
MKVYSIRHGIAAERGTYADDEQRPLTNKGIKRTTEVAQRLLELNIKFDLILTSPLIRAYQTTEILHQVSLSTDVEVFSPLKPGGQIKDWLEWLEKWQIDRPNGNLALVGHQPDLSNWAEMLIWGTIKGQMVVKKAGIIGLELPSVGTPIARSTLFLLTSPKWLIC